MQNFSLAQICILAYQSIGTIYGDIGTSPLYVYSSTFSAPPDRANLLGALSIIVWAVTLMVTVKYILIILHADNDGGGGTFSTYSLLSRYVSLLAKYMVCKKNPNPRRHISRIAIRVKLPWFVRLCRILVFSSHY